MLRKSLLMVVAALFVFSFVAAAVVSADETKKLSGTVDSVNADTGEVTIKDAAGNVQKLKAGPDIDMESLNDLKPGDAVSVEVDSQGLIKSMD
jgi:hypothetical protein